MFGNYPPQMVPMDLDISFQGLALIQGQIYNPGIEDVGQMARRWLLSGNLLKKHVLAGIFQRLHTLVFEAGAI